MKTILLAIIVSLLPSVALAQVSYAEPLQLRLNGAPSAAVQPSAAVALSVETWIHSGWALESIGISIADRQSTCTDVQDENHHVDGKAPVRYLEFVAPSESGEYSISVSIYGGRRNISNPTKPSTVDVSLPEDDECKTTPWLVKDITLHVVAPVVSDPSPSIIPPAPTKEEVTQIVQQVVQAISESPTFQEGLSAPSITPDVEATTTGEEVISEEATMTPEVEVVAQTPIERVRILVEQIVITVFTWLGWFK